MSLKTVLKRISKWGALVVGVIVLISAVYLAPFFLLTPEPPAQPAKLESADDLDRYFSSMVDQQLPPAMDITVLKDGERVFSQAYGLADGVNGEVATIDHVYHFWSMTKTFTAVAIFQLVENGKLSLDSPITTYLPQFVPLNESGDPVMITIGNLLNHRSGLPDFSSKMFAWIHEIDAPRFGETRMVNERLGAFRTVTFQPGSESQYANINYVLLGAVIEAVTDNTYENYVREEILLPLNMKHTDFVYRPDMLNKAVRGSIAHYTYFTPLLSVFGPEGGLDGISEKRIGNLHWLKLIYTDYAASTSLIGTGLDLSRFGQMLLNHGELAGIRILSEENARNILQGGRLSVNADDVVLGYGIKTLIDQGVKLLGHGGGGPGFALQYLLVPEKALVIVVLTNATMTDSFELSKLIASVF